MDMDKFLDQHTEKKGKKAPEKDEQKVVVAPPVKQPVAEKIIAEPEMLPKEVVEQKEDSFDNLSIPPSPEQEAKEENLLTPQPKSEDSIVKKDESPVEQPDYLGDLESIGSGQDEEYKKNEDGLDLDNINLDSIGGLNSSPAQPTLGKKGDKKEGGLLGTLKGLFGGKKKGKAPVKPAQNIGIAKDELDDLSEKAFSPLAKKAGLDNGDLEKIGDISELEQDSIVNKIEEEPSVIKDEFDLKPEKAPIDISPPEKQEPEEPMDDVTKIHHLIAEAHLALSEKNVTKARDKYLELNKIYDNIPANVEGKNEIYHEILELYNSILNNK